MAERKKPVNPAMPKDVGEDLLAGMGGLPDEGNTHPKPTIKDGKFFHPTTGAELPADRSHVAWKGLKGYTPMVNARVVKRTLDQRNGLGVRLAGRPVLDLGADDPMASDTANAFKKVQVQQYKPIQPASIDSIKGRLRGKGVSLGEAHPLADINRRKQIFEPLIGMTQHDYTRRLNDGMFSDIAEDPEHYDRLVAAGQKIIDGSKILPAAKTVLPKKFTLPKPASAQPAAEDNPQGRAARPANRMERAISREFQGPVPQPINIERRWGSDRVGVRGPAGAYFTRDHSEDMSNLADEIQNRADDFAFAKVGKKPRAVVTSPMAMIKGGSNSEAPGQTVNMAEIGSVKPKNVAEITRYTGNLKTKLNDVTKLIGRAYDSIGNHRLAFSNNQDASVRRPINVNSAKPSRGADQNLQDNVNLGAIDHLDHARTHIHRAVDVLSGIGAISPEEAEAYKGRADRHLANYVSDAANVPADLTRRAGRGIAGTELGLNWDSRAVQSHAEVQQKMAEASIREGNRRQYAEEQLYPAADRLAHVRKHGSASPYFNQMVEKGVIAPDYKPPVNLNPKFSG